MRWCTIAIFFFVVTAKCPAQTDPAGNPQKQIIHGKVLEAKTGEPIRKVSVQVSGVSGDAPGKRFAPYSATTNSDERFSISKYTLVAKCLPALSTPPLHAWNLFLSQRQRRKCGMQ